MSLLSIGPKGASDEHQRYRMPAVMVKIEGRGNGIKTVIPNMADIAKALHVDPAYPTKFFGIELGAQSKWSGKIERAVVNGAHQSNDMQDIMYKFITTIVLCPRCKLPELKMDVRKSSIKIDCAACGDSSVLKETHKIISYIIKHPPNKKKNKSDTSGKKKGRKGKGGNDEDEEGAEADAAEGEVKRTVVAQVSKAAASDVWHTDISKDAVEARKMTEFNSMGQSNPEVEKILKEAQAENKEDSASTMLQVFLASGDRDVAAIVSELDRLQIARGLDAPGRFKVLFEALLDFKEVATVGEQFVEHQAIFKALCNNKTNSLTLLRCLEELVGVIEPALLNRTPMILQQLYECDILLEDYLIEWFDLPPESSWLVNKEVALEVKEKAAPLIDWLKEAESESDEE